MPKPRSRHNRGLPKRWTQEHGAYFYKVPPGLEHLWDGKQKFRLGAGLPEAHQEFGKRTEANQNIRTIGQLLDRYALEVVPLKGKKTQKGNFHHIARLRSVFGHESLTTIQPKTIYQYFDKRTAKGQAKLEISVLRHAFTKAVEWGYIDRHPFKGQTLLPGSPPRTRYIEDWEIAEVMGLPRTRKADSTIILQAYIRLKLMLGLRRGDMLRLQESNLTESGILVKTNKTGKATLYEWTDGLREAVTAVKACRPADIAPWLFCTRRGKSYLNDTGDSPAFDGIWLRFMRRLLAETKITESFREHDLRAKVASDADSLDHARALLSHANSSMTNAVYRRAPEKVKPLK